MISAHADKRLFEECENLDPRFEQHMAEDWQEMHGELIGRLQLSG